MIGFAIGTLCLIALVRTLRGGRRFGGWRGGHWGPRAALRLLFERLDTSPGQEKVILSVVEELWKNRREIHEELEQTRKDAARAMRGDAFDHAALDEAFARHDALKAKLRENVRQAMATVHEALDERQRKIAGDLIEGGLGYGRCGHGRFRHHGPMPEGQGLYRAAMWT